MNVAARVIGTLSRSVRGAQPSGGAVAPAALSRLRDARARRIRTPTVLQMEATECGAAALAIVLAWHGRHLPLEELRQTCGVSRDGSNAASVLQAARLHGMKAKGFKKEPAELRSMALPMIVFWNFGHFVVVEGFAQDHVFINDPATGPRKVSNLEFDRAFTGVVLAMEKSDDFVPIGRPPSAWRSLLARFRGQRSPFVYLVACTLALVVPGLVAPVYSRVFVDQIFVGGAAAWLNPLLALMALTAVLMAVLTALQLGGLLRLQNRLAVASSSRFMWRILRLPMTFFTQRYAGDVIQRVSANQEVASILSSGLSKNVVNLMMVGFYGVLMALYDPRLAAIVVFTAILQLGMLRWMTRARSDENRRLAQDQGKVLAVGMTGLQMIETLKATGGEHGFFMRWAGYHARMMNSTRRFAESSVWFGAGPALLGAVSGAAVMGFGGLSVMDGVLTMGMFIAFQALMSGFMSPVAGLVGLGDSVQNLQGALARLDDVLEHPLDAEIVNEDRRTGDAASTPRLEGGLELRDLTFGFNRLAPPLVRGFNLRLHPGMRVALVGVSGSGKSTIARLVAGLHQPWEGQVLLDGRPRDSYPRAVVASSVGIVDQDVLVLPGSARDNITLWDATIEDHEVVEAARDACLHDEISSRPGGYDRPLAEAGADLSGGQRQRLELARALVRRPRLLILDEATSALDPLTEQQIERNLRRRGCTQLIVAHRLSTIRDCDEIIVLHNGRIVQRGTHDAMSAVPGPYAALVHAG